MRLVTAEAAACSPTYPIPFTGADVIIDMRLLLGHIVFVDRTGKRIPMAGENELTDLDPQTGELRSISAEDVETTEIHFVREDPEGAQQAPVAPVAGQRRWSWWYVQGDTAACHGPATGGMARAQARISGTFLVI
jgi:hypothetical protein